MKLILCWLSLLGLAGSVVAAGNPATPSVDETVSYLIKYTADSKLTFIRNGSEHTSVEAADLMKRKFDYAKTAIQTPEDFIRLAATKSHLSGKAYLVKMPDGKTVPSADWLGEALKAYRVVRQK